MRLRRYTARSLVIVAVTVALLAPSVSAGAAPVIPTAGDTFSALVGLRSTDGMYVAAIHASVMPDGRVFMMGTEAPTFPAAISDVGHFSFIYTPDAAGATLPATEAQAMLMAPVDLHDVTSNGHIFDDSLVCGGMTFLSDGRLMVAGGTRVVKDAATGKMQLAIGGTYGTAFNGTRWTRLAGNMTGVGQTRTGRWYPTLTRLANGKILVTGGYDNVGPSAFTANLSEELYDPLTSTWTTISSQTQTPVATHDADYTAVFQLPTSVQGADVLMIGEDGLPIYMSSATTPATWRSSGQTRPGSTPGGKFSNGAGTAMLPIRLTDGAWGYHNGSVLTMSGLLGSTAMTKADVFDPVTNAWTRSIDTGTPRHYPAPVLLPDGRVLLINGHDSSATNSVLVPQYLDPANNFALTTSPTNGIEVRGYHNVAVLLPDGRVLVGGGRDLDRTTSSEKPDLAYFSPSYLSQPRPVITSAPGQLGYGQSAYVGSSTVHPVEAVLMGLPSMTHSFDENQRSVQISLTSKAVGGGNTQISQIVGPADASVAPPGYYMLFVLDANRVPSVAKIVHIG